MTHSNLPDNVTDKMIDDHFGSPPDCEECDGSGCVNCPDCSGSPCQDCNGTGEIECPDCEGYGTIDREASCQQN